MPRVRFSYGTKSKKLSKVNIMTKKSAKQQATQINALVNKVKAIEKKQKATRQWAQYTFPINNVGLSMYSNNGWSVEKIVHPAQWLPLYQASTEVANANKITVRSLRMELYFRISDSRLPLTPKIMTCFLCKLRNETAMDVLENTNNMSSAGFGADPNAAKYWNLQVMGLAEPGLATLSPAAFEIVKVKKFQIQNIIEETAVSSLPGEDSNVEVTNPSATFKRFTWKLRMGNLIKTSGNAKWKDLNSDEVAIKDRLYLIIHQGGNGTELTPELGNIVNLSSSVMFTCRGTN